jgi:peptidyl-prolyl cis-trans isomerase D
MLRFLRQYSRHWVIGLIIGAIVVVFIFWGMGTFRPSRGDEVAEVNGTPIPLKEYYRFLSELQQEGRIPPEMSEEARKVFREMVRDELITRVLLDQAAARLGLRVSAAELQEVIARNPRFQEDGRFSLSLYQRSFGPKGPQREARMVAYEEEMRRKILLQKLMQVIASFAKVSEAELKEHFREQREEVAVDFAVVSPEAFAAKVQPGEEELKAYFSRHAQEFQVPEKARVRYVLLRFRDFLPKVEISPPELEYYIKEHADEMVRPRTIRVREVVVPLAAKVTPAERQKREKLAQTLLARARQGEDFAALAKAAAAVDPTAKGGSEPRQVSRGQEAPAWEQTAFALTPGETALARTDKGFFLIKLEEITEREPLPAGEAKARAEAALKEAKSRTLAEDEAQRLKSEAVRSSLAEAAKKLNLKVEETPAFTRVDPLPGLGPARGFNEEAFKTPPQGVALAEVEGGLAVLQVLERTPTAALTYEQAKDRVRQAVVRAQAQKLAQEEAGRLLTRVRQGEPLSKVASQANLPFKDSGWFSRSRGFAGQPLARELTSAAFALGDHKKYPDHPVTWQGKFYLLAFKGRRLPSPEDFQKARPKLEEEYLNTKRRQVFNAWLRGEWQRAKIAKFELPS